jgi:hypothetical protein
VTVHLPEQRRETPSQPVIHLHLATGVDPELLGGLLSWMRRLPAADTVDLTVAPFSHPAMPDAVLADIAVLTADGVRRTRGVGRTAHAAIEKVRLNYRRSP